jgi:hypothetical protein
VANKLARRLLASEHHRTSFDSNHVSQPPVTHLTHVKQSGQQEQRFASPVAPNFEFMAAVRYTGRQGRQQASAKCSSTPLD